MQAAILLWENPRLQQWVRGGDYIFVEGYFVKNSTRYVRLDAQGSFRLKPAAKKNPAKAFLRIDSILTKDYVGLDKDLDGLFHLEYRQGVDKRIIYLDPAQQATPDDYDDQKVYASRALLEIDNCHCASPSGNCWSTRGFVTRLLSVNALASTMRCSTRSRTTRCLR